MYPPGGIRSRVGDSMFAPIPYQQPNLFDAYGGSIQQTGSNYDELMGNYRKLLSPGGSPGGSVSTGTGSIQPTQLNYQPAEIPKSILFNPISGPSPTSFNPINAPVPISPGQNVNPVNFNPVNAPASVGFDPLHATTTPYHQSADVTSGLATLQDLANTGGYSAADQQNIRERGISPIRSVYANAQQQLERNRALGGGYSPNTAAVSARMARDMAGQLSGATTNVNAQLAQNIAQNKLSAAPAFSSAAANESAQRTSAEQANTNILNQIAEANAARGLDVSKFNTQGALDAAKFNTSGQLDTAKTNADIAAANEARRTGVGQFNANLAAQIAQANSSGATQTGQFNADMAAKIALANQQGQLDVNKTNVSNQMDIAKLNAANKLAAEQGNQAHALDVAKFNFGAQNQPFQNQLEALKGMTSLYGTTPALASTFGDQALKQQQLTNQAIEAGLLPVTGGTGIRSRGRV